MNKRKVAITIGVVVVVVAVVVLVDTMLANHQPAIVNLEAEPDRVVPSGTCQIVCNATDSDDDELSYGWSADGGAISGEGATVTWTAPGSQDSYNVTVIVLDSHGSGVTDSVTVTVRRNNSPRINNLVAGSVWTLPSGSLNVTCDASDPDGDELSYEWTATGGNISGTGTVVDWTAPQEVGIYNITAVVRDSHGSPDTWVLPVSVVTGQPPIIEELLITKDRYGHCYLKTEVEGSVYKVGKEQMYDIECIVLNTSSEVSYEWSCTGGNLSGMDSLVTWTAPNTQGKVTVTVIVSDIAGNMVSKNLILNVVSCSTCTFGSCSG
jgi:hypothetical protein